MFDKKSAHNMCQTSPKHAKKERRAIGDVLRRWLRAPVNGHAKDSI